ncbi:hypothetical protein [Romboutsia sp.]|uniref:hypothetical protein n=1 Tax=Romboutsia sp. TaxID=1965302 RepID=UPI003F359B26
MDNFVKYLKDSLDLSHFTLIKTAYSRAVIFKVFKGYTKCIYINIVGNCVEIRVDKVFDEKDIYKGIERLIISSKYFSNMDDSVKYIKRNIAI